MTKIYVLGLAVLAFLHLVASCIQYIPPPNHRLVRFPHCCGTDIRRSVQSYIANQCDVTLNAGSANKTSLKRTMTGLWTAVR